MTPAEVALNTPRAMPQPEADFRKRGNEDFARMVATKHDCR